MTTTSDLQKQLQEAEAVVKDLEMKLNEARNGERIHAIAEVQDLIKRHGLTASDLGYSSKGAVKELKGVKRAAKPPKYQDPATEKTWTGQGRTPNWLSNYLESGGKKEELLIQK